jgi:hypothetical protein
MKKVGLIILMMLVATSVYAQSATIWFYRSAVMSNESATVYWTNMPTRRLASLKPGEFFGVPVTPGIYGFSYTGAPARGQSVIVAVNAGEQAYIEIGPSVISLTPAGQAIAAIQRAQPIGGASPVEAGVIVGSSRAAESVAQIARVSEVPAQPATVNNVGASRIEPQPYRAKRKSDIRDSEPLNATRPAEIVYLPFTFQRHDGGWDGPGGTLSLTININERIGLVADMTAHRYDDSPSTQDLVNYRFGPKLSWHQGNRLTFFGQFLVGGSRITETGPVAVTVGRTTTLLKDAKGNLILSSTSANGFAMFSGGGMDIALNKWLAFRAIDAGYSGISYTDIGWENGLRGSVGLVFRIR